MRILLFLLMCITLSSCKYGVTYSNLKSIPGKKDKVELIYSQELNTEGHEALRSYFSSIKSFLYEFKSNTYMQNYTHRKFFRYFDSSLCDRLLIPDNVYTEIMRKCNVSGFYICAEEVRHYKNMLGEAKKLLTDLEISKISEDMSCKIKLRELGI